MRWNSWGLESESVSLPAAGIDFLIEKVGTPVDLPSVSWECALAQVPASRIDIQHPSILLTTADRLCHAIERTGSGSIGSGSIVRHHLRV